MIYFLAIAMVLAVIIGGIMLYKSNKSKPGTYGHPVDILDEIEKVLVRGEGFHYVIKVESAEAVAKSGFKEELLAHTQPNDAIVQIEYWELGNLKPSSTASYNLTRSYGPVHRAVNATDYETLYRDDPKGRHWERITSSVRPWSQKLADKYREEHRIVQTAHRVVGLPGA